MKRSLAGIVAFALGNAAHLLSPNAYSTTPKGNGRTFEEQQAAIEAAEDKRKRRAAKRAHKRG